MITSVISSLVMGKTVKIVENNLVTKVNRYIIIMYLCESLNNIRMPIKINKTFAKTITNRNLNVTSWIFAVLMPNNNGYGAWIHKCSYKRYIYMINYNRYIRYEDYRENINLKMLGIGQ